MKTFQQLSKALFAAHLLLFLASTAFAQCGDGMLHRGKITRYGEDLMDPQVYGEAGHSTHTYRFHLCRFDFQQERGACSLTNVAVASKSSAIAANDLVNKARLGRELSICARIREAFEKNRTVQVRPATRHYAVLDHQGKPNGPEMEMQELVELYLLQEPQSKRRKRRR